VSPGAYGVGGRNGSGATVACGWARRCSAEGGDAKSGASSPPATTSTASSWALHASSARPSAESSPHAALERLWPTDLRHVGLQVHEGLQQPVDVVGELRPWYVSARPASAALAAPLPPPVACDAASPSTTQKSAAPPMTSEPCTAATPRARCRRRTPGSRRAGCGRSGAPSARRSARSCRRPGPTRSRCRLVEGRVDRRLGDRVEPLQLTRRGAVVLLQQKSADEQRREEEQQVGRRAVHDEVDGGEAAP